jgi:hypothetical protein
MASYDPDVEVIDETNIAAESNNFEEDTTTSTSRKTLSSGECKSGLARNELKAIEKTGKSHVWKYFNEVVDSNEKPVGKAFFCF